MRVEETLVAYEVAGVDEHHAESGAAEQESPSQARGQRPIAEQPGKHWQHQQEQQNSENQVREYRSFIRE